MILLLCANINYANTSKCQCMFIYVWLSALPAVVLASSYVLSPAPWYPPSGLRTCTLLPSPPPPALTAMSPTLLVLSHASSGTACTQPTGKLARGARWKRNCLLGTEQAPANRHLHKTFWWLMHFPLLLINLICGFGFSCSLFGNCFVTVFGNYFARVYGCASARRPVGQELWNGEWSVWPQKANRPNTAVHLKDLSLKQHVRTDNVSQSPPLLSCPQKLKFLVPAVKRIQHLKVSAIL